ncbi:hypothetical protein ACFP3I_13500 [Chryseobacterium arachidis]|uniref:hypothetical protein n=1 Tax=Chryseobacterium arachidis TaxID=1416778 RepID=UPI0036199410
MPNDKCHLILLTEFYIINLKQENENSIHHRSEQKYWSGNRQTTFKTRFIRLFRKPQS